MTETGPTALEQRIEHFESLLEEMKETTREAHSVLKQLRAERKEIEKLFATEARKMVAQNVSEVVKTELDKIGPEVRKQTSLIYDKVGQQIDKLVDIALGKEFSSVNGREDLRPELAKKMRVWIREVVED